MALVVTSVALLFKLAPRRRQPDWSWLAFGAAVSALLWLAFMGVLKLYIEATDNFGATYGPIAGTIGVLLWAFAAAVALFLGLAFAAQLEAVRAGVPAPRTERDRTHRLAPMNAREAVYEMWRERGMTTMFGNPGSTELPMLKEFPDDFRYVLALQEAVAVGMADGYAQASGTVGHVNLHTAPGVGNGMGGIFNAQANKTPLLVTAGQQSRSLMTLQANLTNRDATRMPHPLVKWSYEPPRAEDVPHAIARGTYLASLPPRGPVFVSIRSTTGTSRWTPTRWRIRRSGSWPGGRALIRRASATSSRSWARRRTRRWSPGPDIDMCGGWDAAVKFAEKQKLSVWATPAPGGGRLGFPRTIRCSAASCRRRSGRPARR